MRAGTDVGRLEGYGLLLLDGLRHLVVRKAKLIVSPRQVLAPLNALGADRGTKVKLPLRLEGEDWL